MNSFTLSKELLDAVVQYLGSRPYVETFQMIQGIQAAVQQQVQQQQASEAAAKAASKTPVKPSNGTKKVAAVPSPVDADLDQA